MAPSRRQKKDTITASCPLSWGPDSCLNLVKRMELCSLALAGCSVVPGNPWARTCMTPFHPTAGWLFLATELSIRWEYAGDERCWPNHMGMAQNIESDTSIPYGIQSFWWWLRTMTFKLLNINLPNSTFQAGLNRNMLELNQCNTGFISLWCRVNRS